MNKKGGWKKERKGRKEGRKEGREGGRGKSTSLGEKLSGQTDSVIGAWLILIKVFLYVILLTII